MLSSVGVIDCLNSRAMLGGTWRSDRPIKGKPAVSFDYRGLGEKKADQEGGDGEGCCCSNGGMRFPSASTLIVPG